MLDHPVRLIWLSIGLMVFGVAVPFLIVIKVIESIPGTRIYGVTDLDRLHERVPTVSFTLEGKDPEQVADAFGAQGIYVWNGHNYALAIVERLGLLEAGGMVRVGPVHYNTLDEIARFGEVFKEIVR